MEKPHKKLQVWQSAMDLVGEVYKVTARFPECERYGLISQIRRCAVSIPSNIAEGAARQSASESQQFIHVAMGSASELDTQLEICHKLGYLESECWKSMDRKLQEIDRMLSGLRNHLRGAGRKAAVRKPRAEGQ